MSEIQTRLKKINNLIYSRMASQIRKEINTPCVAHQVQLFLFLLLPSFISLVCLSSLLPLASSLPLSVCLPLSRPPLPQAFHSFIAPLLPLPNKPALTLLHVVRLLRGRPWQGLQRGTHLAFLFFIITEVTRSKPQQDQIPSKICRVPPLLPLPRF